MENATKALLIIGATMLAILTLTIGVYMMGKFGNVSDTYVTKLDIIESQKYNSNFEVFIGRNDITAQEIVSVASIARQKEFGTKVFVNQENITDKSDEEFRIWTNKFLTDNILKYSKDDSGEQIVENMYSLVGSLIKKDSDGKISEIKFKKIN